MINPKDFYAKLIEHNVSFFTGVPDSLLSNFSAYLQENADRHLIAANEGNAIALAAGSYFASGNPAFVYMQNSGQGNTINPLVSLADPSVYGVPMLLLVGWRGEPGKKDEPQHMNQGAATCALFDSIDIPWYILPEEPAEMETLLEKAIAQTVSKKKPVALIVKKGTFSDYKLTKKAPNPELMTREEAIQTAAAAIDKNSLIVATTGQISRELYSYKVDNGRNCHSDFLTVGSMGHSSQIALGIAMEKPDRQVYCFDGDGSVLMHMGGLAIVGTSKAQNLVHIVFNNAAHDSVGGLPTVAGEISLTAIAKACGYTSVFKVSTAPEIAAALRSDFNGPAFIEIAVNQGSRNDLPRPQSTPSERKDLFMDFLRKD